MRLRSMLGTGTLALAVSALGCTHYVQRGETLYREHRYIEAAEAFERTEARLAHSSVDERAEYGLYRGLTFLSLDDVVGARTWLGYAYAIVQKVPSTLRADERALLERGWLEVDQRSRGGGVARSAVTQVAEAVAGAPVTRAPGNGRRSIAPE